MAQLTRHVTSNPHNPSEFEYFKDDFDFFGILSALDINTLIYNKEDLSFVLEIFQKYGIRIPDSFTFEPQEFLDAYDKYYKNPQNYWEPMSFDELIRMYGPQPKK